MSHPDNKKERNLEADKKAKKAYNIYYKDVDHRWDEETKKTKFGMLRKTRKFCSDPSCCGNPRRLKGNIPQRFTLQELKNEDAVMDEIDDELAHYSIVKIDL